MPFIAVKTIKIVPIVQIVSILILSLFYHKYLFIISNNHKFDRKK